MPNDYSNRLLYVSPIATKEGMGLYPLNSLLITIPLKFLMMSWLSFAMNKVSTEHTTVFI